MMAAHPQGRPTGPRGSGNKWPLMFLRRDENLIQCLVRRALLGQPGGSRAVAHWYDDEYLSPLECELPVDSNVLAVFSDLFF